MLNAACQQCYKCYCDYHYHHNTPFAFHIVSHRAHFSVKIQCPPCYTPKTLRKQYLRRGHSQKIYLKLYLD